MPQKEKSKPKPPYQLSTHYPSSLGRRAYRTYNGLFNRLYPVKPYIFGTSLAAAAAYHVRNPQNILITLMPKLGHAAQVSLASFLTAYTPVFLLRCLLKYWYFSYKGFLYDDRKNVSLMTKIWYAFGSLLQKLCPPKLCSAAGLLPNVPVPALKDTVVRYLETVKPILSDDEYEEVKEKAMKFLREEGPKLQMYAKMMYWVTDNYVTGFWEKYAYLYNRECLLVNTSVAHCDLIEDIPANQAVRAAQVCYIEGQSMVGIDKQRIKPVGNGLVSTTHYDNLYAGTRIPGQEVDQNVNYGVVRHVAVLCRGCFYKVHLCDARGKAYTPAELADVFKDLLRRRDTHSDGEAQLAALTTDKRDSWHKIRNDYFLSDPQNRAALEMIESSAFMITLEGHEDYDYVPEKPEVLDNFLRNMLTGDGTNRWADKSLNYIVAKNGRCGGTTEHSTGDGAEFDHIMENFVYIANKVLEIDPNVEDIYAEKEWRADPKLQLAERFAFNVNESLKSEIDRCLSTYSVLRDDVDFAATVFTDWGKNKIKEGRCSPDGFLQMAIQLASYRDQGKFNLTYESASQRFYANSRTETLRTVSDDSCNFVKAMEDPSCSKSERLRLLRKACESHVQRNKDCMTGKGVDRHLFVLFVLSKGTKTSSDFLDYYISQPWVLSTSQPPVMTNLHDEDAEPHRSWLGACFGPVAKNGYGVCYRFAGNHTICAHITSFKSAENTDSHRFQQHLKDAFHEMADLFEHKANGGLPN
uniref:Carn_acyltransf domain-containing protein n=1 Tax=Steinernema glaseri TaxID=37863 RepID=A0A1I8AGS1_9BILA